MPIRTQAQKTAGLAGGEGFQEIFDITYAPSNPNTVYLIVDQSQAWKSTDGGSSWVMKHRGFGANGGSSIAVHPRNENIVFVTGGTMDPGGVDTSDDVTGIFRTTDGGENWTQVRRQVYSTVSKIPKGADLFAFTSDGNTIYNGSESEGLLRSTDGGATWTPLAKAGGGAVLSGIRINDIKMHPSNNSILFVSAADGFYRVVDAAPAATQTKLTVLHGRVPTYAVINSLNGNILYLNTGSSGVYKTTDGGLTWAVKNTGINFTSTSAVTGLAISPTDPTYLYLQTSLDDGVKLYYSHDSGESWTRPRSTDERNADGWVSRSVEDGDDSGEPDGGNYWGGPIAVHPTNRDIALVNGTSNRVKKTLNGGVDWRYSASGWTGGRTVNLKWDKTDPNKFVMFLTDYGPYITTNGGDTFRYSKCPRFGQRTTNTGAVDPSDFNRIIATPGDWDRSQVAITRNGGASWTQVSGTEQGSPSFSAFHPTNPNIAYVGWFKFTHLASPDVATQNRFVALTRVVEAMFPRNGDIVYARSVSSGSTTIHKSTDGGSTWTSPYPVLRGEVTQMAIDPQNSDKIYAPARDVGVYVVDGATSTLKNTSHGLLNDPFGSLSTQFIAVDQRYPNNLVVGTRRSWRGATNGVFRSTNGGDSWSNITGNLGPEFTTWGVFISPLDGYVYVGSSLGTWKLPPSYASPRVDAGPSDGGAADGGSTDGGTVETDRGDGGALPPGGSPDGGVGGPPEPAVGCGCGSASGVEGTVGGGLFFLLAWGLWDWRRRRTLRLSSSSTGHPSPSSPPAA